MDVPGIMVNDEFTLPNCCQDMFLIFMRSLGFITTTQSVSRGGHIPSHLYTRGGYVSAHSSICKDGRKHQVPRETNF